LLCRNGSVDSFSCRLLLSFALAFLSLAQCRASRFARRHNTRRSQHQGQLRVCPSRRSPGTDVAQSRRSCGNVLCGRVAAGWHGFNKCSASRRSSCRQARYGRAEQWATLAQHNIVLHTMQSAQRCATQSSIVYSTAQHCDRSGVLSIQTIQMIQSVHSKST
jgi:hypothetical protein